MVKWKTSRTFGKLLREIAIKYHWDPKKHRYELVEEPKKQCNRIFIDEKLAIRVIMDCRTTPSHRFRTRLGFKQYYVILTKEQSMLTRIMNSFEEENMQTQSNVLANKIDSYFHDYKLAIEINKNGDSDRSIE